MGKIDGMTIRPGADRRGGCSLPGSTGHQFYDHRLPQVLGNNTGNDTRMKIMGTAGPERHDKGDRLAGKILRKYHAAIYGNE